MMDDELKEVVRDLWQNQPEGLTHPLLSLFSAALSGFVANKDFHGAVIQGDFRKAVEFAAKVVQEVDNP